MAAKNNYLIIEENILRDPVIEDLILQGGADAFGYYIQILTIMRDYKEYGYRLPIKRLDIIASSRFLIYDEAKRRRFGECVGLMVALGILKKDEDCIWSERRTRDLFKQDNLRDKQTQSALETNRKRGLTV